MNCATFLAMNKFSFPTRWSGLSYYDSDSVLDMRRVETGVLGWCRRPLVDLPGCLFYRTSPLAGLGALEFVPSVRRSCESEGPWLLLAGQRFRRARGAGGGNFVFLPRRAIPTIRPNLCAPSAGGAAVGALRSRSAP